MRIYYGGGDVCVRREKGKVDDIYDGRVDGPLPILYIYVFMFAYIWVGVTPMRSRAHGQAVVRG